MTSLKDFYKTQTQNIEKFEGNSQQLKKQTEFLKNIVKNDSIKNVMEIGFNAGHSAELFLSSNKNIKLVSFDIGNHNYVELGKAFIDKTYPNRHTLIIGNSLNTVPKYFKNKNKKFDIIFIDGGHDYEIAKADILNCKNLAHAKTIVIMDDTMSKREWRKKHNTGPTCAWNEFKRWNIIKEIGTEDYIKGRGQSWGHYLFKGE